MEIKIKMIQQTAVLAMRKTTPVSVNFLQEEIEKIVPCSVIGTGNKDEKDILLYIKDDIKEISINKVNEICDFMEHLFIAIENIYIQKEFIKALTKDYHVNIDPFYETTKPSTKSLKKAKNF